MTKQGKPVSRYRGVEPTCQYCYRRPNDLWECGHPKTENIDKYTEPCTTLEREVCPLRQKKEKS